MELYKNYLKEQLDKSEKYREMLFRRGYLFTNKTINNTSAYPFYGLWNHFAVNKYHLYVHEKQTCYVASQDNITSIIIGHAYNPFDMTYDENVLCKDLLSCYKEGMEKYFNKISEFTGLHVVILVDGDKVIACQDACGLTGCYYGKVAEAMYITEHPQLVADLCGLQMEPVVEKLIQSKCYNIGNRHLPGDITPYKELKRIGANTYVAFDSDFIVKRFYPLSPHAEFRTDKEKDAGIKRIGNLIHNGIECCSKKWKKCAISLSGGTDSKTTLACANGLYDKFSYFSFYSKPQELVDAQGAKKICEYLGLKHTLYEIPQDNQFFKDFELIKRLLQHNTNYFVNLADNEIRKYIYLHDLDAYDIELKSWASEVARVFLERKYDISFKGLINERQCSIFQTRYFGHPDLLKWSDKIYCDFLKKVGLDKPLFNYEPADMFYWEVRMGCWGVSVVSSQQLYHRVTMPINNRKILELFLAFPHDERKNDSVHKKVMAYMCSKIIDANVDIPNLYFHSYRILLEKIYYKYRTVMYRAKIK